MIASRLHIAPILKARLEKAPLDIDHPSWVEDDQFDIDRHIFRASLPAPHDRATLQRTVGWSLGGVYARDLALQAPDMVRSVITLGSPFANDIRATNATRLYELVSGEGVDDVPGLREAIAGDLPVPATSIYSRTDGIVNWRTSLLRPSATAENIEVHFASHLGIGVNPAALWAVADRLAQPEGEFRHFDRSGPFAIAYAPPENAQS